jgi:hypothetical protein
MIKFDSMSPAAKRQVLNALTKAGIRSDPRDDIRTYQTSFGNGNQSTVVESGAKYSEAMQLLATAGGELGQHYSDYGYSDYGSRLIASDSLLRALGYRDSE